MTNDNVRIDVGFPAERSIGDWARRHDAGEVPGHWPYGLDGLRAFGDVRAVDLAAPGRIARARSRFGFGPRSDDRAVGLTWDENSALRMTTLHPHTRQVSGVIWLTDAAARGRDLGRMPAALGGCAALWVLSDAQLAPLRALIPNVPVEYLRFGIDEQFYALAPPPPTPRIVSVGGDRDRDTETLYRALALVHAARPEVELVVQTSSDLAAPPGVQRIRHLPHVELRSLYASASVVAIATRPNLHVSGMTVSLEAMATGRPVAITRTPGMADYVADGETGLLSDPGDAETLASDTLALLDDPARAEAMGAAGRRSVENRFTSKLMSRALAELVARTG